jgi:hypothetical protein
VQLTQQAGGDRDAGLVVGQGPFGPAGEVGVPGGHDRVVLQRSENDPPGGRA